MNAPSSARFFAPFIAALILLFSLWQVTNAVMRLQSVNETISSGQNQSNNSHDINPDQWLIIEASHGAAGASLQARLRASARSADISLARIEIQPPNSGAINEVKATAQASGNIRAIAKFIYQLESQTPALVIEKVRIYKGDGDQLDLDLMLLGRMNKRDKQ